MQEEASGSLTSSSFGSFVREQAVGCLDATNSSGGLDVAAAESHSSF